MKFLGRFFICLACSVFLSGLGGCKSIRLGGSGSIGGISGSGGISIPVPHR